MKKLYNSLVFLMVLGIVGGALTISYAQAATLNVVSDSTKASYYNDIIKSADRLIALQDNNGSWGFVVTGATGSNGTTYYNVAGVTAQALLDAYSLTNDTKYLNAAKKTGDYLVEGLPNVATNRQNAFNVSFLVKLGQVSNDPTYTIAGRTILNTILTTENYWSNNNGNNCTQNGCTPEQLLAAYKNYRGVPSSTDQGGIVPWDLMSFVQAAHDSGDNVTAQAIEQEIVAYVGDPTYTASVGNYALGLASAVKAAEIVNDTTNASSLADLLIQKQGSQGEFGEISDGQIQTTAYALMAFNAIGNPQSSVAAQYIVSKFGYSSINGWQDSDGNEYAETDSEAAHALAQLLTPSTYYSLQDAINIANAGDTLTFGSDITVSSAVTIDRSITINGAGHKLIATFAKTDNSNNAAIMVNHSDVTIENLIEDGTGSTALHGINVYQSNNVNLNNVTVSNNGHNGIVVNGSNVTVNNITTANNTWGGIDVDLGNGVTSPAVLTITGGSSHSEAGPAVFVDDITKTVSVVDSASQYSFTDNGNARTYKLSTVKVKTSSDTDETNADVRMVIPSGTTVTGSTDWDGVITPPSVATVTLDIPDYNTTVTSAISIGSGSSDLTFDRAVKLTFAGQANKLVGWYNHSGTFSEITTTCSGNIQTVNDGLATGDSCKINDGTDLVVWTKHFSTFLTYTSTPIQHNSSSSSSGGGYIQNIGTTHTTTLITTSTPTLGEVLGERKVEFSLLLKRGSKGAEVTALQKLLTTLHYYSGSTDGNFGPKTFDAVETFQAANPPLKIDGIVGPATRAVLNK